MTSAGTAGLGKETILALSKHNPSHIYFTGRNSASASAVQSEVKAKVPSAALTFIPCDQNSLASVHKAAREFVSKSSRLDVLLCNAGIMATGPGLTADGYENQFGVNHVAHALLVKLLLPTLEKTQAQTDDVRIIFLTSLGFRMPPPGGIIFKDLKTVQDLGVAGPWARYGQSKLANVIYPAELARRYPSITSISIHPGTINTDIIGRLNFINKAIVYATNIGKIKKPHEGAYQACWASTTAKTNIENGAFYEPVGQRGEGSKDSVRKELWEELWTWTQKELEPYKL